MKKIIKFIGASIITFIAFIIATIGIGIVCLLDWIN